MLSISSRRTISYTRKKTTSFDQWPGTGGTSVRRISLCTPPPPPNSIALVKHWAVLMELLFLAGARVQRMFRDFDMQRGGTLSSSVYAGPPVWPEPWDFFRLGHEGTRRVERGGYEGPQAEPVPRCVRPPPGFEGTEPAEGGYHGRPSITEKYRLFPEPHPPAGTAPGESTSRSVPQVQPEKPNHRDAEDPPVKRRISKPASQWQGKKRGKKPAEIKHRTEQTAQTPLMMMMMMS